MPPPSYPGVETLLITHIFSGMFKSFLLCKQELLLYGIKGMAAYAEHALILGHESDALYAFISEALYYLAEEIPSVDKLFALCLKCGEVNLAVMELLDTAKTASTSWSSAPSAAFPACWTSASAMTRIRPSKLRSHCPRRLTAA